MFERRLLIRKFPPHLLNCNHCHGSTSPLPHTWTKEATGDINKVLWKVSMLTYQNIFFQHEPFAFLQTPCAVMPSGPLSIQKGLKIDETGIGWAIKRRSHRNLRSTGGRKVTADYDMYARYWSLRFMTSENPLKVIASAQGKFEKLTKGSVSDYLSNIVEKCLNDVNGAKEYCQEVSHVWDSFLHDVQDTLSSILQEYGCRPECDVANAVCSNVWHIIALLTEVEEHLIMSPPTWGLVCPQTSILPEL